VVALRHIRVLEWSGPENVAKEAVALIAHLIDSRIIFGQPLSYVKADAMVSKMRRLNTREENDGLARAPHFSESLARGLSVLRAFDRNAPRQGIAEIAERTEMSRAAARRFLLTLRDLGYVGTDGNRFFLRPLVLELGYKYLSSANITSLIQPMMDELADRTKEATTLAVLDGSDVLIVARATRREWDLSVGAGSRLPAARTTLGLVLISALSEARQRNLIAALRSEIPNIDDFKRRLRQIQKQGFAVAQRDLTAGWSAIALPIEDATGAVVAAVNITSYEEKPSRRNLLEEFMPSLREVKLQIETALRTTRINLLQMAPQMRR
jgi:IclR family pca regulon transcriptional regulator